MANQITPNPSVPTQVVQEMKFPKFINNLGIIPTSYKDSMSYYECLAWLCKYLEETVIPTLNQNGEAVEELQNLYIELNSYVTHYFETLDVQEEINNKLDQMVEDGTLPEIVADYLKTKAIFGFDTVADMKAGTNLINGSFAQTFGFYEKNDGGKALYKIRNITNDDIIDEITIIKINDEQNQLIAELITSSEMNIKQFGYLNNETDFSTNLQKMININKINSIDLLNSEILIYNTINLRSNLELKNGKINANNLENVLNGFLSNNEMLTNLSIVNIYINGNNTCLKALYLRNVENYNVLKCHFENFTYTLNTHTAGIDINRGFYGLIEETEINNIGINLITGTTSNAINGIVLSNANYNVIDNCYVHDIKEIPMSGDGIHFLGNLDRSDSNNIVQNCTVEDCAYRCIKIQEKGITIKNCIFKNSDSEEVVANTQSTIAIYDSDVNIIDNIFDHQTDTPIDLGSTLDFTDVSNNVSILNNTFHMKGTRNQGAVSYIGKSRLSENLIIKNNKFLATDNRNYGVDLRGYYKNAIIENNVFDNVTFAIVLRDNTSTFDNIRDNLLITNNTGSVTNGFVYVASDNFITNGTIITNNSLFVTNQSASYNSKNTVIITGTNNDIFKSSIIEQNKIRNSQSIEIIDGVAKIGASNVRPAMSRINDGFIYFDTTLLENITYYNNAWYHPDGTVIS